MPWPKSTPTPTSPSREPRGVEEVNPDARKSYDMIHDIIKGDITTAASGLILHQVNCRGVMSSGVALAIRNKWPSVFEEYQRYCRQAADTRRLLGRVLFVPVSPHTTVANLFAQDGYGRDGLKYTRYDALDDCMGHVKDHAEQHGIGHIHFPALGCGTGGGHWPVVREIIEHQLPDPIIKNLWVP